MKVYHIKYKERKLVGVIREDGSIILESSTPSTIDKGFPCHVIRDKVSLTTGNLDYWLMQSGSKPIYEGDKVAIEF